MKLKQRIILSNLIAFNIVVIISMSVYFFYTAKIVKNHINNQNQLKTSLIASRIDEWLSQEILIVDQAVNAIQHFNITDYQKATDFLVNLTDKRPTNEFALFYENGIFANNQVWTPPPDYNARTRPWYKAAKSSDFTVVTNPYLSLSSKDSKTALAIAKNFKIADTEAVFISEINLNAIEKLIKEFDTEAGAYAFLISENSVILLHPNKAYELNESLFTSLKEIQDGQHFEEIINSITPNLNDINVLKAEDYDGMDKLFYFAKNKVIDWTVAFVVPESEICDSINKIKIQTIILALILVLTIVVISFILAKRLALPLEKMAQRLKRVAKSNNEIKDEIINTANYELKEIATSFNNIINKIGKSQNHSHRINLNSNANVVVEKINQIQDSNEKSVYLLYIDIDKFKTINKLFGYYAGNELIEHIYSKIEEEVQSEGLPKDSFMHVVNDEFSIFYRGTEAEAFEFADRIINKISKCGFVYNDKKLLVCISVGIVPVSEAKQSPQDVLVCAFEACSNAFADGGNCYKFLSGNDSSVFNMENVTFWLTSIQNALKENRFILYKQAIVPLNNINPHKKYEMLIRLKTEDGEIVGPDAFIPIAEHYNMIYEIDKWVIKTAFEYYSSLQKENSPEQEAMYSINISADSFFSNDLINYIFEMRAKYDVPASKFCFELTESCAVRHLDITQKFITELRKKGFSFALDDFGKGFSSFPYLKTLPIDYVKIDGSFIKSIDKDYVDFSMVKTMRDMCYHLGLSTVGEYAENDEIVTILKEIGIDYGQGYFFQKPIPINEN